MNCTLCNDKTCLISNPCDKSPSNDTKPTKSIYLDDQETRNIYKIASEVPKNIPRIEEVRLFIEKMQIKRVGVAFCKGLQNESKEIVEFLTSESDSEFFPVICAYEDENKSIANSKGAGITCNPAGQAGLLNNLDTQLNITIGLCVGHDILFSKYSVAPITTLLVKDRVYKHKPLNFFFK